jgi:competence protein ComEA
MRTLYSFLLASLIWLTPLGLLQAAPTVDINSADSETMVDQLVGIGPQKAMEIVRHRQKNGPFKTIDALAEVKGIGPKTVEQNRARIMVAPAKVTRAK